MLPTILAALLAASSPSPADDACAVGAAALRDLALVDRAPAYQKLYGGRSDEYHFDVLDACPALAAALPTWLKLADQLTLARWRAPDFPTRITLFQVSLPRFDARHRRATVRMGYSCTGLCGSEYEAVYLRTRKGWRLEGAPVLRSVS